jgi:hypothetical protein
MPDMLVKLYGLPGFEEERLRLEQKGIRCRRAESYERGAVLQFIREHWPRWADEGSAAFGFVPPTMFIAARGQQVVGFAAYNATRPNYFGPTGVAETERKSGIGKVLLLQCLGALAAEGYAYAIIGGVGPAAFYERAVGATIIEGSEQGIYGNHVTPTTS